jgi:hypothetical protein
MTFKVNNDEAHNSFTSKIGINVYFYGIDGINLSIIVLISNVSPQAHGIATSPWRRLLCVDSTILDGKYRRRPVMTTFGQSRQSGFKETRLKYGRVLHKALKL